MAKQMRRLAAEHASLHQSPPTDYIFPAAMLSDDLTCLDTCLIGPTSTPYENGIWRLHIKMTDTYPREPPKASFRTKIFHPNVEERSGEVCVDTLKSGWTAQTTLRDVLSTIRCLLIHPNPSSALNAEAGMLADEDYAAFTRQARLMTKIHATVPPSLRAAVKESRRLAEEESRIESTASPTPPPTSQPPATNTPPPNVLSTPTKDNFANPFSNAMACSSSGSGKENNTSGRSPSHKKRSSEEMERSDVDREALNLPTISVTASTTNAPVPPAKVAKTSTEGLKVKRKPLAVKSPSAGLARKGLRRL